MRIATGGGGHIELRQRDIDLLRGLFESRIMTSAHAAALYFGGSREAAKKRLQRLKAAGMVGERRRRVSEPALLALEPKGMGVLRELGILGQYPALPPPALARRMSVSEATVRHELAVMDTKAAFHAAARKTEALFVAEFSTWPRLHQFEAATARGGAISTVKPDGFLRMHEKRADGTLREHRFFVEVDRSTESLETLADKARRYLEHFRGGGFAERNGSASSDWRKHPFRVLFVFETEERRNNFAERLAYGATPILTQAWLSTLDEVTKSPFGPIWVRPLDYREATKGTRFHEAMRNAQHRRWASRETFVAEKMERHPLFGDAS